MEDTLFDHLAPTNTYFPIPQIDDVFASIRTELESGRLLCCFTGFPKSGKTSFLDRLRNVLTVHSVYLSASRDETLAAVLLDKLSALGDHKTAVGRLFTTHKHVVLLIDNAHLLKDKDFALVMRMYVLAEHHQTRLQIILGGNGELMLHLGRPENRQLFNMLGSVWNLPKLTIGQSLEYVRFLLKSAGLAEDFIPDPLPLAKRAAGTIGVLRMLVITFALKALGGQQIDNAGSILDPDASLAPSFHDSEGREATDVESLRSPWVGRVFVMVMATVVCVSVFALFQMRADKETRTRLPDSQPEALPPVAPGDTMQQAPITRPIAKTVFRKRADQGPYSLRLGTFPSPAAMLLNLPKFTALDEQLLWSGAKESEIELYVGRFETSDAADAFATRHELAGATTVLRPFVATIGPITSDQVKEAALIVGLPEPRQAFVRDLTSGMELQFSLERSMTDALDRCSVVENNGFSCAVTEYE